LEPGQPIAVTFPASSEAIDALPGTKGGSPRVVPDETKLAITDSASRGSAMCKTFGAGGHCCLLLAIRGPTFFHCRSDEPVRFSDACTLGRSRSTAQLNVGKSRASKGLTELYEGLWRPPLLACSGFGPASEPSASTDLGIPQCSRGWEIVIPPSHFLNQYESLN
jgi:hypothetical protein